MEVGDARFVSDARSMTSNPRWMQRAELVLAGEDVDEQVARVSVWDKRTSNRKSGENMTCLGAAVFPLARLETFRPTALDLALEGGTRDGARVAIVLELRDAGRETKRENEKTKRAEATRARRGRRHSDPGAAAREVHVLTMPPYTTETHGDKKRDTRGTANGKDAQTNARRRGRRGFGQVADDYGAFEVIEPTPSRNAMSGCLRALATLRPRRRKTANAMLRMMFQSHTARWIHADSPSLFSPDSTPRRLRAEVSFFGMTTPPLAAARASPAARFAYERVPSLPRRRKARKARKTDNPDNRYHAAVGGEAVASDAARRRSLGSL